MRTLPLFLCLALPLFAGCNTTHASVPTVDKASALELVTSDLVDLTRAPSEAQWRRTYRHFDQHVEPHLTSKKRLQLEVQFGILRSAIGEKNRNGDKIAGIAKAITADLQPQD